MAFTETRDEKLARLQQMARESGEYRQMKLDAERYQFIRTATGSNLMYAETCPEGYELDLMVDMALAAAKAAA